MALECIRSVVGHPFSGVGNWDLCVRMCSCVCLMCLYELCGCVRCCVWMVSYSLYDGCDR